MTAHQESSTKLGRLTSVALLVLLAASFLACSDSTEPASPEVADRNAEPAGTAATAPRPRAAAPRRQPADLSPPFLEARIPAIYRSVLVPLHEPQMIAGGLPTDADIKLGPDGSVIYKSYGDLYQWVGDPAFRDSDGEWTFPEDPAANDEDLSTPACQGLREGFDNPDAIRFFWVDPDGRVAYTCPQQQEQVLLHYVDGPTVEMGKGVIYALGTESRTLGRGGRWDDWGIDDQGTFIPVETRGTPWARNEPGPILADRDGFLVAFINDGSSWDVDGLGTLHRLHYDGRVDQVGEYGPPAETVSGGHRYLTLAPGGDLYLVHSRSEEDLVFLFRSDFAEPGEIVYRAPNKPWAVRWVSRWSSG
jgi:hypothetical protein